MRQFKRSTRLGEQILRDLPVAIGDIVSDRFKGMITFTKVRLTDDLRYATVYYSFLGKSEEKEKLEVYFQRECRRFRKLVGSPLRIKHIPEFSFKFDTSVEAGLRIEQLLNEVKDDLQS
ncbi:MAG: 30S ribosome-binding factor RbfA [candidate division Zixibacteria bacterium]|nr:30S ribosome-binding factor RbfA [candidate division Zixibacteria bacterium]